MSVTTGIHSPAKAYASIHKDFASITIEDKDGNYVCIFLNTPNHATVAACVAQYLNDEIDQPPPPPPVAEDTDDVGF